MKESKLTYCKFCDFEDTTNYMLRQGWEIVNFAPQNG